MAIVIGAEILAVLAFRRHGLVLRQVVDETYSIIEWAEVEIWLLTAFAAAWAATRQARWRMLALAGWFGVVSVAAGLRELDLHVVLNPANIHLLGLDASQAVRFRLDWWTDAATPVGLRVVWGLILLAAASLVIVPLAIARYPWFERMYARELFSWMVAAGFGCLAGAYVMDDFLGRPLARRGISVGLVEESTELLGQIVLLGAVFLLGARARSPRPITI